MKKAAIALCLFLGLFGYSRAQTYELVIDSVVGFPDTVVDGQEINFWVIVSSNSNLFYQGNIYVELEYAGVFNAVDSSSVSNTALGPNLPTTIQASHRLSTDDGLSIGDNVVVVWPRIGDGQDPPQSVLNPYSKTVTIVEPAGIFTPEPTRAKRSFLAPNPASSLVRFAVKNSEVIVEAHVYDALGKLVLQSNNTNSINIGELHNGIYLVQIFLNDGQSFYDRLLITR